MKSNSATILVNVLVALTKATSAFAMFQNPEMQGRASIPLAAVILLVAASVLIAKRSRFGPLLALFVIGFFLLQFLLLGAVSAMFGYFALHLIAFLLNLGTLRAFRQDSSLAEQYPAEE